MCLSRLMLRMVGWRVEATAPDYAKCVICVAPHTSNWDFIIGKLAYASIGRRASFMMKSAWFFFPLNYIFKAMGGIPVRRGGNAAGQSLVADVAARFKQAERLQIAITPEGTRSRTAEWRTGFLRIARLAGVPCVLAAIDYSRRLVLIDRVFWPSGDVEADMRQVKDYYKLFIGKHPEKFTAE